MEVSCHVWPHKSVCYVMNFDQSFLACACVFTLDPHEDDKITAEGMMRFLDDLGLNPESRTVLILAWKFGAATQCVFTKEEFINGLMELG